MAVRTSRSPQKVGGFEQHVFQEACCSHRVARDAVDPAAVLEHSSSLTMHRISLTPCVPALALAGQSCSTIMCRPSWVAHHMPCIPSLAGQVVWMDLATPQVRQIPGRGLAMPCWDVLHAMVLGAALFVMCHNGKPKHAWPWRLAPSPY